MCDRFCPAHEAPVGIHMWRIAKHISIRTCYIKSRWDQIGTDHPFISHVLQILLGISKIRKCWQCIFYEPKTEMLAHLTSWDIPFLHCIVMYTSIRKHLCEGFFECWSVSVLKSVLPFFLNKAYYFCCGKEEYSI